MPLPPQYIRGKCEGYGLMQHGQLTLLQSTGSALRGEILPSLEFGLQHTNSQAWPSYRADYSHGAQVTASSHMHRQMNHQNAPGQW